MPKPQTSRIPDRAARVSSVRRREKIIGDLATLQEQLAAVEHDEALRLGQICLRSGLADFEIPDHTLEAALKDLAVALNPTARPKPKAANNAEGKIRSPAASSSAGEASALGGNEADGSRFPEKPAAEAAQ